MADNFEPLRLAVGDVILVDTGDTPVTGLLLTRRGAAVMFQGLGLEVTLDPPTMRQLAEALIQRAAALEADEPEPRRVLIHHEAGNA